MPMYKRPLLVLLFIAVLAGGSLLWNRLGSDQHPQEIQLTKTASDSKTSDDIGEDAAVTAAAHNITVYVSGEVNAPGLVELEADSRIGEAVEACGGFTALADKASVNLAQKAEDGMQINIQPRREETQTDGTASSPAHVNEDGIVHLNTAEKAELDTLPGIGPAMADRIIAYRRENGSFKSIEEIKNVKGIGEAKFAQMKDRLRL